MCFRPQVSPVPSPEDGNRSSFKNAVLLFLEHRTMDKVQKPSSPECHILLSEPFKDYRLCFPWIRAKCYKKVEFKAGS
jgi:hypothetical protein